jgi:hypothetical protein
MPLTTRSPVNGDGVHGPRATTGRTGRMVVATDAARADTFSERSNGAHPHPGGPAYRRNAKDIVQHPETLPASRSRRSLINAREVRASELTDEWSERVA